ncbi:alpha/beta hydrolase [Leekyejoonella antrihumi]|uniref:Alpha/beta hydrolase n=1 Tax=Leekyejoonella antrihumi TaxID=1660198 RepID=A0A563E2X5_9MICO|nr:alpha/beta hydrolase [Leekyejoonella antrihumi]TWP36876.1 alpha/beta hydrolase [Leekyejoonella antrihumi]
MSRTRWVDTAGMPLRTRMLCYSLRLVAGKPISERTDEDIAADRSNSPAPRFPVTLITGKVWRDVFRFEQDIPMRDGVTITARIHRPAHVGASTPVLVYYHGGGWVMGRPLDYESMLTQIVHELGVVVVAPDYRKAPQAKAPAAVHDAVDTLTWVASAPSELGTRPAGIAVGGDSAGGNLAALVAIAARDEDCPDLAGQVLIYPATDLSLEHPMRTAPMLDGPSMDTFKELYLGGSGVPADDPRVSPMRAASHEHLAPALVQTAELDPLRPEGEAYAEVLRAAGVPVRLTRWRGVPHGFVNIPGATHVGMQARYEIIDQLRSWLCGDETATPNAAAGAPLESRG